MLATFVSNDITYMDRVGQTVEIESTTTRHDGRSYHRVTFSDGFMLMTYDSELQTLRDTTPESFASAPVRFDDVDMATIWAENLAPENQPETHTLPVRVFRNLTRKCVSIQARIKGRGWLTIAHADEVELASVRFHVSEAGRQRVIRERKKSVHAWVEGDLIAARNLRRVERNITCTMLSDKVTLAAMHTPECDGLPVTYNPFRTATFVTRHDAAPIRHASRATVSPAGAIAA